MASSLSVKVSQQRGTPHNGTLGFNVAILNFVSTCTRAGVGKIENLSLS